MGASGLDTTQAKMRYSVDMRYVGQMNEVPVSLSRGRLRPSDSRTLRESFEALYRQRYGAGTTRAQAPLEIISFQAEAVTPTEKPAFSPLFENKPASPAPPRRRPVYLRGRGFIDAAVYSFDRLAPDIPMAGPAIIERESTTIWLPPSTRATLDVYGNLTIYQ
jgi:N-methylhydantoinase A